MPIFPSYVSEILALSASLSPFFMLSSSRSSCSLRIVSAKVFLPVKHILRYSFSDHTHFFIILSAAVPQLTYRHLFPCKIPVQEKTAGYKRIQRTERRCIFLSSDLFSVLCLLFVFSFLFSGRQSKHYRSCCQSCPVLFYHKKLPQYIPYFRYI